MKINLHKLACELARLDDKKSKRGYDENVVGAETTLKTLGRKLRSVTAAESIAIIHAIVSRAGLCLLAVVLLAGCASFNNKVFRAEQLAADTSITGVSAFNAYVRTATNGMTPPQVAQMQSAQVVVWEAARRLSASLAVSEHMRQSYESNVVDKAAVQAALATVTENTSNLVYLVNYWKSFKP